MKGRPFGLLVPPSGVGTPKLQTFFFLWWYWSIGVFDFCIIIGPLLRQFALFAERR